MVMPVSGTLDVQPSILGSIENPNVKLSSSSLSPSLSAQNRNTKSEGKNKNGVNVTEAEVGISESQYETDLTNKIKNVNSDTNNLNLENIGLQDLDNGVHHRGHADPQPISSPSSSLSSLSDQSVDDITYPEGGFSAWIVVLGSFFGMFSVLGLINSMGAVQAYVSVHQLAGKSESEVSWIFSVYVFLCYLLSGQVGPLFDAYGPYQLTIAGTLFMTFGLMMTSLCTQYYQFFLAFSICCGIGCALLMTPQIAVIGHYFKNKRGTAIGTASIGGSLGGVVFPLLLRHLYASTGYPWALRILGFLCFGTLVTSLVLTKPRLERDPSLRITWRSAFDFSSLADKRFVFLILANFLGELAVVIGITFLTSYALSQGKSESLSYALLTILNTLGMLGRWLPGLIADKVGRFNTLIATTTMAFITIFAIWLPFGKYTSGLIIFAVLHGFCNGGILSLAPVCCGQICRTRDYGARYGTMYVFTSFGVLVGVPVSGALIRGSNYTNMIIFTGCLYIATTAALIISRYYAVGLALKKW